MAACKYTEGSMAKRAITAALVGVLSVGTVPMVALAEGVSDGISQMAVTPANAWANGTLTAAEDNSGHVLTDLDNIEFEVGSDCTYLIPTEITPAGEADPVAVSFFDVKWEKQNSDGSWSKQNLHDPWGIGTYRAVVEAPEGSGYTGDFTVEFRVVGKSLKGLDLYNAASGSVYDDTFTYNGVGQSIGYILDGQKVDISSLGTVTYYVAGTDTVVANPVDAGNYIARIEGTGNYAGSIVEIPFTIDVLDLSAADVVIRDTEDAGVPLYATVNGVPMGDDLLDFGFVSAANGSGAFAGDYTTYTVNVTPEAGNTNMTGSKQVTFSRVHNFIADSDITYGGSIFTKPDGSEFVVNEPLDGKTMYVLTDKVDSYFNPEKISVKGLTNDLDWVTITDASGNVVDATTVNTVPGTYTVTVRVNAADTDYQYGSNTVKMTVKTYKSSVVADASLYFKYDNRVVNGDTPLNVTYDGGNVMDSIDVLVQTDDATLSEGTDYTVTIYDANGTEVDEIVNAGTYTIQVSSDVYNLQYWSGDCSLTVVVNPISLDMAYLGSDDMKQFGDNDPFIPYSGDVIDYYFYYMDGDTQVRVPDGVLVLDHFNYDESVSGIWSSKDTTNVAEMRESGRYSASIKLADGVQNYTLANSETQTVVVMPAKVFADVDASAWYALPIYDAKTQGYINGYAGQNMFGPEQNITRGDVACVLFNMAGAGKQEVSEDYKNEMISYAAHFSDVDENQYYAMAIGWAAKLDIVNGYPDGTFKADQNVTREEFAAMLANYARAVGDYEAVDADEILSQFPDGNAVTWGSAEVAWAAANDIMGNGGVLNPTGSITRAEVAAMAVNYQPEVLSSSDLLQ